jgi:hypothetical protein
MPAAIAHLVDLAPAQFLPVVFIIPMFHTQSPPANHGIVKI